MRRRELLRVLGCAAAAWPLAARGQQSRMPVIGFLNSGAPAPLRRQLAAFHSGLKESGYVEGQNVAIDHRFAKGQFDQFPVLASALVSSQPAVLVAISNSGALAAKQATATIPIVFGIGGDAVALGLVASLNRPGANMTGVDFFTQGLEAKRLGLLHEIIPKASTIAVLFNPSYSPAANQLRDIQEAAIRLGVQLVVVTANAESDFDAAFTTLAQRQAGALLVTASPFFNSSREQLVLLAARQEVPAIYEWREFVEAGGLMSYGTNLADSFRQIGIYVGRILNGAKPADLPVIQSTKFEFVLNLKTAKALHLDVPSTMFARADEVIE